MAEPEEMASVAFLCSSDGSYITVDILLRLKSWDSFVGVSGTDSHPAKATYGFVRATLGR
jgi:hypothetical protein